MKLERYELRLCPFCGENLDISLNKKTREGKEVYIGGKIWFVTCLNCGARTEDCYEADTHYCHVSAPKRAVRLWNNRWMEDF